MDSQMNQDSKQGVDSVALALLNALTSQNQTNNENCLKAFLIKIYRNNVSSKSKYMNSIRLNRFNAFLYKINHAFPTNQKTNKIIFNCVIAALNNERNFLEEQDEEATISIARWIALFLKKLVQNKQSELVLSFLNYLINDARPSLPSTNVFDEQIRNDNFFSIIELTGEDQSQAIKQDCSFSITSNFSIKDLILKEIQIQTIYGILYNEHPEKHQIISLFSKHTLKIDLKEELGDLFIKTFLFYIPSTSQELQYILESIDENYFDIEVSRKIIQKIVKEQQLNLYYGINFKNNCAQQIFLQELTNYWKKRDIKIIINSFINCTKIQNSIPLLLIIHSESLVPAQYASLLFEPQKYQTYNHQHAIVTLISIAQHFKSKNAQQLIQYYQKNAYKLTPEKKTYFFSIFQFTLCKFDLSEFYILLLNNYDASKIKKKPNFTLIKKLSLDMTSISSQFKTILVQMLQAHSQDEQNMSQIRNQLMSFCLHDDKIVEKIKQINSLLEKPFEQIAPYLNSKYIKNDAKFVLALLMGLNNKLKINFIQQPSQKILQSILSLFFKEYNQFGSKVNDYEFNLIKHKQNRSAYYSALFKYNLNIQGSVGCLEGKVGDLLTGSRLYNRVENVEISQFLMKEQKNHDATGAVMNTKRLIFQLYTLFKQILSNNEPTNFDLKKDFRVITNPQYKYILAIHVIKKYFQCQISDTEALKSILQTITPQYKHFENIQKNIESIQEESFDFLQLIPDLLNSLYPQTIRFLSKIIDSQPIKRQKFKNNKKNTKTKKGDKKAIQSLTQQNGCVFQNTQLFEEIIKKNGLKLLFGDSSQLQSFDSLLKIVRKIEDPTNTLEPIINQWLHSIKMFHYTKQTFEAWKLKLLSFCELWKYILVEKMYQINKKQLERHFLLLTEMLNALYEKHRQCFDVEEKILLTLLSIYQAALKNIDQKALLEQEKAKLPLQNIRTFFLNSKLEPNHQQHFYYCFTCKHGICQICAPFLHKNHDINYLGKQGSCVHDSNMKSKIDKDLYRMQAREILQATSFLQQPGTFRSNSRRQEDIFLSNYQFPQEDLDYLQHLSTLEDIIGFKQVMERRMVDQRQMREQRQRERQRLRQRQIQKQFVLGRQRQRIERQQWYRFESREKDRQLRQIFEAREMIQEPRELRQEKQDKVVIAENSLQIKSQTSKSIKNVHISFFSHNFYEPQFNPAYESQIKYQVEIDMKPLRIVLLRQIQLEQQQQSNNPMSEGNKISIETVTEKYLFFNKSHFFKNNYNRNDYNSRGSSGTQLIKRTLLTNNNKFLAFPSTHNGGIVLLSMVNMVNKFQKRLLVKNFAQIEQQRAYALTSINNSNLSFQPYQIAFSKSNPNMIAIIGLAQIGFGVLNNEGKLQKYMQADFKSSQTIQKFQWLACQKNIFAACSGNSIRIGTILDEVKVKTMTRFKLGSDKTIKDFQIIIQNSVFIVYMIDNNCNFYKSQFDVKDLKTLSNEKKIQKVQFFGNVQSLIVIDKKVFLSASDGNCYLIKSQIKNNTPHLIKMFDLSAAFKLNQSSKFLKPPYYISQARILHKSEVTFSLGCLLRRQNADPKRRGGLLAILRINDKNKCQIFIVSDDESVESFDFTQISQTNFLLTYVDQHGSLLMHNYIIPSDILSNKQEIKMPITQNNIIKCNNLIKDHNLLYLAQYSEPKRYAQFKDSRDITQNYNSSIDNPKQCFKVSAKDSHKYFWTGLSFKAHTVTPNTPSELQFHLFGQQYRYQFDASRQIQIPLTIKESIDIFTNDKLFQLFYIAKNIQLKDIKIYGLDFNTQSVFKKTYYQIYKIVLTNISYAEENIESFLQNTDRSMISKLNVFQFANLKTNNCKYTQKEVNLLLKLQLLRQSVQQSSINQKEIEESIIFVKENIFPICQKRNYLQKSCQKVIKRLSNLAIGSNQRIVGHPYEYRTFLDLYLFQRYYRRWNSTKHFSSFTQLVQHLYSLIYKRLSNLYIIFKLHSNLIYQLTFYYKNALNSLKNIKMEQKSQQSLINRLVSICPNFVALICQYYQTLKNTKHSMIDQNQQVDKSPEKNILDLLEEVFCATRKELYRQIFVSPQKYLQRLYLSPRSQHEISSAVNIFQIKSIENEEVDHASRKASLYQVEQIQKEEDLQLQEQSQKQLMQEQEARFMFQQVELKENNYEQQSQKDNQKMECQQNENGQIDEKYLRISNILKSHLIANGKVIPFVYYQFSFEIITALFNLSGYLNKQNSVFYMGFFFNLLRIIEINFQTARDKIYLQNLFKAILDRISHSSHSIFYMVLNYFFQPIYQKTEDKTPKTMIASNSRLAREFIQYCDRERIDFCKLFSEYSVSKQAEAITLSEVMKFKPFQIQNQLYQLHFLANLYLNHTFIHQIITSPSVQFQKAVLSGVVKYKLRILINIMVFNKWQSLLEGARVVVGFETLKEDMEVGIDMLYDCSIKQPQTFITKLCDSSDLVDTLQKILGRNLVRNEMVMQMLNIYYSH